MNFYFINFHFFRDRKFWNFQVPQVLGQILHLRACGVFWAFSCSVLLSTFSYLKFWFHFSFKKKLTHWAGAKMAKWTRCLGNQWKETYVVLGGSTTYAGTRPSGDFTNFSEFLFCYTIVLFFSGLSEILFFRSEIGRGSGVRHRHFRFQKSAEIFDFFNSINFHF